jgi:hypothetical protein
MRLFRRREMGSFGEKGKEKKKRAVNFFDLGMGW